VPCPSSVVTRYFISGQGCSEKFPLKQ